MEPTITGRETVDRDRSVVHDWRVRIVLGTDSFTIIRKALTDRLAVIEAQHELASSTDFAEGQ